MDRDFFEKLSRGELPDIMVRAESKVIDYADDRLASDEDYLPFDTVDLRGAGATIYRRSPTVSLARVPIVHCSRDLGHDWPSPAIAPLTRCGPGEVWIEQMDDRSARIYYPSER